MIIDAENAILGRIGTKAAKAALRGEEVTVINCGSAVLSGDRKTIINDYVRKRDMGIHAKGPFYFKTPAMFVKRSIRGMIPKNAKGREALKRIKCYAIPPEGTKGEEKIKLSTELPTLKKITVKELCKIMGAKE